MDKKKVDLKRFLDEVEGTVESESDETLAYIAEETDPIVEWKLLQTVENSIGQVSSFIVFTTESGVESTLPLLNDNVSELLRVMILTTPDLDPKIIPYVPTKENFWRKYKKQVIFFSVFFGLFTAATIANIIVSLVNGPSS